LASGVWSLTVPGKRKRWKDSEERHGLEGAERCVVLEEMVTSSTHDRHSER